MQRQYKVNLLTARAGHKLPRKKMKMRITGRKEFEMDDIFRCEICKYYNGLVEVEDGFGLMKNKINCFKFGYLDTLTDLETCKLFKEKEEK